jgi:hypothetical protein
LLIEYSAIVYRKNDLSTVAATIRKIQAPNQLAAVLEVSGSPDENFEYTFTPPIRPTTAPIAYTNLVAGSKYELTMFVASVIPPTPFPCANALKADSSIAAEKRNLFFIVETF